MPHIPSILTLYTARERIAATGALAAERDSATWRELAQVARAFLAWAERCDWGDLPPAAQQARLRKGRQRFRQWERGNPDLVALLHRKARAACLS